MRKILIGLTFCSFLLPFFSKSYSQTLGFELNDTKRVNIPFEVYNNLIVVPVVLNNQIPLKFILDTGVRTTILTEKSFSDILNLTYSRKYTISGLGGERHVDAYITNNVSLSLPGVSGKGHAMLVLAEDYLELRNYLGTEVHGILGYEIFSRFIVTINYDKKVLTLTTPEHFKKRRRFQEVEMKVEDTKPYISGRIVYKTGEHLDVKLLVDTGASHGLLLDKSSDPQITIPEKHITTSLGRGLGGLLEGEMARLKYFHLGEACWQDILATFPETNSFLDSLKNVGTFRNGSVGGEILSRFTVVINFPEEKLYLKKGKSFKKDFTYNLSGLVVKAIGSRLNTYEITEVRKNSVGEKAGFKKGDVLVSINSIDASRLRLSNITNFLNARENKKLKLTVLRDGVKITQTFRLKSQI
ncbi:aspartyl protease family protein [Fulvivirga sp. 29W222]|uniref:Aspartyl protease family protein n=1 Tax=Fulvivirga marina TaxID=2494733 RepID=A0A937FXL4_9BACT|nr:aspartyl protease family protein [Fulvivirga marina]MBL6446286.1 aspartyl protease family protein [Fulvivirga marina]